MERAVYLKLENGNSELIVRKRRFPPVIMPIGLRGTTSF